MLAINVPAIFKLVRLTIPDVTLDEVGDTIMQNFPYMGGAAPLREVHRRISLG